MTVMGTALTVEIETAPTDAYRDAGQAGHPRGCTGNGQRTIGSVAFLHLVLSAAALLISQLLRQGLDIGVRLFGEVVETASLLLMTAANVAFLALFLAPVIGGSCAAALAFVIGVRSFRMRLSVDRQIIGRFFRDAILVHFGRTAGAATSTLSVMALVPWCSTRAISRTMSLRVPLGSWSTPILSAAATLAVGTLISRTNLPGTAVASLTLGTHLAVNFASHALPLARWASLLAVRPSGPGITIARAAAV